ncbi:MAG: hypothetical protein WAW39_23925 [Prosthecobacter sp.]
MPSDLKSLITEATRYARFTMKKCGCLAPIMIAARDPGTILFSMMMHDFNRHGLRFEIFARQVGLLHSCVPKDLSQSKQSYGTPNCCCDINIGHHDVLWPIIDDCVIRN